MAVATALAMMVRSQGRRVLEAARHGLGMEMPSVASTRPSYAGFGKHKSLVSTFRSSPETCEIHVYGQRGRPGPAGSTGRGRPRMRMNGVIKLVSIWAGFRGIPTSASSPAFAGRGIQNARQAVVETYVYNEI